MEPACEDRQGQRLGGGTEPVRGTYGRLSGRRGTNWGSTVHSEAGEGARTRSGRTLPFIGRRLDFFFKCKGKPFEGSKQRSDMN